jgi:hypothetical protein
VEQAASQALLRQSAKPALDGIFCLEASLIQAVSPVQGASYRSSFSAWF